MRPIKKDKYFRNRESVFVILSIRCARCSEEILIYQKDGRGSLKRLYFNRILAPEKLALLQESVTSVKQMKMLQCDRGNNIGIPMLHREGRLAFRLIPSTFTKMRMS